MNRQPSFSKNILQILIILMISFITSIPQWVVAQSSSSLTRSTPEAEGVSSERILEYVTAADTSKHEFHSFMLLRHGNVIAEGWWNPYHPDLKHTMYSVSKSFTSTAVGFAVTEGLISVDDTVISFFDKALPDSISSYLEQLTIQDLLTMSVGHESDPTTKVRPGGLDWEEIFLNHPIVNEPGTTFLYNSVATYMVSAIVQKVTGQKIVDYLQPRLFEPLGIEGIDWEVSPSGVNTGGWGLRVKTEDMAKLGQLYLNKGVWNGEQILPESWVEEATKGHIQQAPDAPQETIESSDWLQGYGYQFWRTRHNAFRADGAFGQFIIVLPELDAVVIYTSETPDLQNQINLVWEYLLPAFHEEPLPADEDALTALQGKLESLSLPVPEENTSTIEKEIDEQTYRFFENDLAMESVAFQFGDDSLDLILRSKTAVHEIGFGSGGWFFGETTKRGPYLLQEATASMTGISPFKVAGAYTWLDDSTLELTLRYIESPHTETFICRFSSDSVEIESRLSFAPGNVQYRLSGTR